MINQIEKEKLTIPIYFNTKIVFDMIATIEDGYLAIKSMRNK